MHRRSGAGAGPDGLRDRPGDVGERHGSHPERALQPVERSGGGLLRVRHHRVLRVRDLPARRPRLRGRQHRSQQASDRPVAQHRVPLPRLPDPRGRQGLRRRQDLPDGIGQPARRLRGGDRLPGAEQSDRAALRGRRPGLRGRAKRADQGLRRPRRSHRLGVRRPPYPGARVLGPWPARPRSGPGLPGQALRVRLLCARRPDRRHGAPLGRGRSHQRPVPHPARPHRRRLRHQRPGIAAHRGRRHPGARAGAGRGLVPAVPEPFGRLACLRAGRRPVRLGRRRRELQRGRLRAVRLPTQPVRRRPGRRWRHAHAALGRGRRPAQPGPAL